VNTKALWASMLGFVIVAASLLGINLAAHNGPVLGLDLQGGLSVIYATAEPADQDQLEIVRDLMRGQLEDFGIAEPDVRVEGENIIVDLPGVTDQAAAFDALQVSGIVSLRPVLQCVSAATTDGGTETTLTGTTVPESTSDEVTGDASGSLEPTAQPMGFAGGPRTVEPAPTEPADDATPADTGEDTTGDTADDGTGGSVPVTLGPPLPGDGAGDVGDLVDETIPDTTGQELLEYPGAPGGPQSCLVGPSGGSGEVFEQGSATAAIDQTTGGWVVNVDLRSDGEVIWNMLAQQCFNRLETCPTGQLAIVLDDVIQSAPSVNTDNFQGSVQISGSFSEDEVRDLARVLNRGAFPVPVVQERVETVSPTAGRDSLDAALIAGLIGVALMLAFMVAYYRRLAVVIIAGLVVWGMTVYSLATFVSNTWNYALTLAGATGIVVAVGVTVDTYVVFFERLRDEARHGRTLRNAAPRSFQSTWRTIVSADLVSLMASLILFGLSVGSVRGFALYLGLTTICDLLVCYFFTRPAVFLLARSGWLDRSPRAARTAIGATS
jgi:preprotein translocase subunit SecD